MADLSVSETLRMAAERLRTLAAKAQPGSWHIGNAVDPTKPCNVHTYPSASGVAGGVRWLDAEWIAAMSPAVAEPLANWLDVEIDRVECGYITDALPHALAFARTILDGQP